MPTAPDDLFFAFQQAVAGRYSLDRELGRGGMGVVYLAREVHLDRLVAIKLLPPERSQQRVLRDRFLREARLAAKLSHPNIIPIHAVEDTDGFVFFVMAFVDGETLAERVRARGPLPATDGARVLREIAWALAYAHEQGLIHRDVKPDNILLESSTGRVLVADFGIAAAAGDAGDGISGTPEFMSPEQSLGTALDARSDIYSLGATAYYAFSGRFPFEGATATEVLAKQVTEPARPLASQGLAVPRRMAALVDRCLAKAADQRPESAKALAEQLGVTLEHRRELPAALRTFAKRTARLDGPGTLLGAGVITVGATVAGLLVATYGLTVATLSGVAIVTVATVTSPFLALADAAGQLIKQGFAHRDIGPAFDAVIEQSREELALVNATPNVRVQRIFGGLGVGGLAITAATLVYTFALSNAAKLAVINVVGHRTINLLVEPLFGVFATLGTVCSIAYFILSGRKVQAEGVLWSRLWKGAIGRAAFALASRFYRATHVSSGTHRATELSLGMAAEQLYQSLPRAARDQLSDLPATLQHLQAAAQELRKRHDSIAEALAEAGDAGAGAEYAEVREVRDSLHDRLRDAVGALETIRLNLLRLHAGSATVESVTTHLDIAAEVSAEVERLIAAHGEIERSLNFPRTPDATPV